MTKIKLYPKKVQINDIEIIEWVDKEGKEHFTRYCNKCGEGMYQGHILESGYYFDPECFEKRFTEEKATEMFETGIQYYTEWDESDFDENVYELVGNQTNFMDALSFMDALAFVNEKRERRLFNGNV